MEERRKLPRYVMGSSGELTAPGARAVNVSVIVVSPEGALIECRNPPPVGQTCTLKIVWEGSETEVTAEVRSWQKAGGAGLMFLELSAESRRRLKEICAALPLAAPHPPQGH